MRLAFTFTLSLAACSGAADPVDMLPPVDAPDETETDAPPAPQPLRILVVNEIAAGEEPDWIEVVNATTSPVELSDFVYVDAAGDFAKARAFPAMTLAPGAYYAQDIDDTISGFKLGGDEEIWIYRASDMALSDGVDWNEGDSPTGMSFARVPSVFGDFVTGAQSKGVANP
jgi:hypothetical protein